MLPSADATDLTRFTRQIASLHIQKVAVRFGENRWKWWVSTHQKGGWLRPWVSWPLTTRSQTHFSTLKAHGFHGAYPFHLCSHCDTVCG